MSGGAITEKRNDGNRTNDSLRKKGRVFMPQMNKGGKFVFGESAIRPDGRVQFPPQAVDEYHIASEGKVYLFIATREPKGYVTLVKDLELPECFIMTLQNTYQQSEFSGIN